MAHSRVTGHNTKDINESVSRDLARSTGSCLDTFLTLVHPPPTEQHSTASSKDSYRNSNDLSGLLIDSGSAMVGFFLECPDMKLRNFRVIGASACMAACHNSSRR